MFPDENDGISGMSKINPPTPIRSSDYEAIEAALLDSARGRWFLNEYSQRNRSADTQMLLDAITKLEAAVIMPAKGGNEDRIRLDLIEMSEAIAQTRREIAAITSQSDDSRLITATEELDAIVEATEKATSDILGAAEDVQEAAWLLREKGMEDELCDRLDERATDIYTACSFQDITGQRTSKVVEILRYLESRVNSMIDIWGLNDLDIRLDTSTDKRPDAHLLNGPQLKGRGLEQNDIDDMIAFKEDDQKVISGEAIEVMPGESVENPGEIAPAQADINTDDNTSLDDDSIFTSEPAKKDAGNNPDTAQVTLPTADTASTPVSDNLTFDSELVDTHEIPSAKPGKIVARAFLGPQSSEENIAAAPSASQEAPAEASISTPTADAAVEAAAFEKPGDLSLSELDEPKKAALFS